MADIREIIAQAKEYLDRDHKPYPNPSMANYILRDTPEIEAAGLKEMAWALHNEGGGHENDVLYLIEQLELCLPDTKKQE